MSLKKSDIFKIFFTIIIVLVFMFFSFYFSKIFQENWRQKDKKENYKNFKEFTTNNLKENLSEIFKKSDLNLNEYPNVKVSHDANFFLHNKFLPECCIYYNDYSSDKGCPCITPEQQFFLQRRGGNRSINSFINGEKILNTYFSPSNALLNRENNLFNKFDIEPTYSKPQDEEQRKKILKDYFNIQDR